MRTGIIQRTWKPLAGIAVAAMLIAAGLFWGEPLWARGAASAAQTTQVTTTDIENAILASGTLEPAQMVNVGAQVSGQIKRLHVVLGQQVRQGDLIAEIDSAPQLNALRIAETSLANVKAQRDARIANKSQAEATYLRQKGLLAANATSRTDFEAAESGLAVVKADIAALDAQIERAELEMDIARVNLGYTRILAPIDGVVISVVTKQGQTLNSSQSVPTIVVVAQMDTMSVKIQISEADIGKVKPGQAVWFTLMGDSEKRYEAKLDIVEPAPPTLLTQATDTNQSPTTNAVYFNGLFKIANADGELRPMMTAQVHIVVNRAQGVPAVLTSALGEPEEDGRYRVKVLTATGIEEERLVRTGLDDKLHVQVLEGLTPGERVIMPQLADAVLPDEFAGAF